MRVNAAASSNVRTATLPASRRGGSNTNSDTALNGRLLYWQVGGFGALEDAVDILGGPSIEVEHFRPV
jgi:hypothetical protein